MNCPKCNKILFNNECADNEHKFHYSSGLWSYKNKQNNIIGKDNCGYFICFKEPNSLDDFIDIEEVNVNNCIEFLNRYIKIKSFI